MYTLSPQWLLPSRCFDQLAFLDPQLDGAAIDAGSGVDPESLPQRREFQILGAKSN
jgi:hypothetical protein